MFFVIGPLFLLASRSRELLPDWTIGDATSSTTCMFSGTLLLLIDSRRVSPRLLCNGPFRKTSPGAAKRLDHPRMFHSLYNREKPALHHHSPSEEEDVSSRVSPTLSNQQDSLKSARFSRTSKILSNQPDSLSRDFSHGILRILAHGFLPPSHRPPQLPTA